MASVTMNGRNASGRAVSLLNDPLTHRPGSTGSRSNSYNTISSQDSTSSSSRFASATRGSLHAPDLVHSDSSWSPPPATDSPSPRAARSHGFDPRQPGGPYYIAPPHGKPLVSNGTSMTNPTRPSRETGKHGRPHLSSSTSRELDMTHHIRPAAQRPSPPSHDSSESSVWKAITKNFPCQLAQEYGCTETFTTSGHASRHAKKHTGEKGVSCPMCPKRFARKDNMKQHLKTHENGRSAERYARTSARLLSSTASVTTGRTRADDEHGATEADSNRASSKVKARRVGKRAGSPLPRLDTDVPQQRRLSGTSVHHYPTGKRGTTSSNSGQSTTSSSSYARDEDGQLHSPALSAGSIAMGGGSACRTPQLTMSYVRDLSASLTASPVETHFPSNPSTATSSARSLAFAAPGLDALVLAAGVTR